LQLFNQNIDFLTMSINDVFLLENRDSSSGRNVILTNSFA
jgi:hypothetical protein